MQREAEEQLKRERRERAQQRLAQERQSAHERMMHDIYDKMEAKRRAVIVRRLKS